MICLRLFDPSGMFTPQYGHVVLGAASVDLSDSHVSPETAPSSNTSDVEVSVDLSGFTPVGSVTDFNNASSNNMSISSDCPMPGVGVLALLPATAMSADTTVASAAGVDTNTSVPKLNAGSHDFKTVTLDPSLGTEFDLVTRSGVGIDKSCDFKAQTSGDFIVDISNGTSNISKSDMSGDFKFNMGISDDLNIAISEDCSNNRFCGVSNVGISGDFNIISLVSDFKGDTSGEHFIVNCPNVDFKGGAHFIVNWPDVDFKGEVLDALISKALMTGTRDDFKGDVSGDLMSAAVTIGMLDDFNGNFPGILTS